jgi:hypothetical protein
VHLESVPNGNSSPALVPLESDRENGRARKRILCNDRRLGPNGNRSRAVARALVVSPIVEPASKLAAASSRGEVPGIGGVDEDGRCTALDGPRERQPVIEAQGRGGNESAR